VNSSLRATAASVVRASARGQGAVLNAEGGSHVEDAPSAPVRVPSRRRQGTLHLRPPPFQPRRPLGHVPRPGRQRTGPRPLLPRGLPLPALLLGRLGLRRQAPAAPSPPSCPGAVAGGAKAPVEDAGQRISTTGENDRDSGGCVREARRAPTAGDDTLLQGFEDRTERRPGLAHLAGSGQAELTDGVTHHDRVFSGQGVEDRFRTGLVPSSPRDRFPGSPQEDSQVFSPAAWRRRGARRRCAGPVALPHEQPAPWWGGGDRALCNSPTGCSD
jgi:hypothetical protein